MMVSGAKAALNVGREQCSCPAPSVREGVGESGEEMWSW